MIDYVTVVNTVIATCSLYGGQEKIIAYGLMRVVVLDFYDVVPTVQDNWEFAGMNCYFSNQ